jgi:hypothetical protein
MSSVVLEPCDEVFTIMVVDARGAAMSSRHAINWTNSKIAIRGFPVYTKLIPHRTKVFVRASATVRADATVIVVGSLDSAAERFVSNYCEIASGGAIGVVLDRVHAAPASPQQARISAMATKRGGVFTTFSTMDAVNLDAFMHQMVFLARVKRRQVSQRRPQGTIAFVLGGNLPRQSGRETFVRLLCWILVGVVALHIISWVSSSVAAQTS